jgi:hypothetical protein
VFAQFASKAPQFKKALGVNVDSSLPLNEQFVDVLEEVNTKLRTGKTNLSDLKASFRLFGLRGAKAFEVLAGNVGDVRDTIDELEDSDGLSNALSEVVKESLAKKFESAKQVLLEFMRAGLEPAVEALKFLTDVLKQFQEALAAVYLDKILTNLVVWGGIIVILTQSLWALVRVFSTMASEAWEGAVAWKTKAQEIYKAGAATKEYASTTGFTIKALNTEQGALIRTTAQYNRLATAKIRSASVSGMAGVGMTGRGVAKNTSKSMRGGIAASAGSKGAMGAMGGVKALGGAAMSAAIGGPIGMIATLLAFSPLIIAAFGEMHESIEDIEEDFADASAEATKFARKKKDISSFKDELETLQDEIDTLLATNSEEAADRIRDAFRESNIGLEEKYMILRLDDSELLNQFDDISANIQKKLDARMDVMAEKIAAQNKVMVDSTQKALDQELEVDNLFADDTEEGAAYLDNFEDQMDVIEDRLDTFQDKRRSLSTRRYETLSASGDEQQQLSQTIGPLIGEMEEAKKELDGVAKTFIQSGASDFSIKAAEAWRNRLNKLKANFKGTDPDEFDSAIQGVEDQARRSIKETFVDALGPGPEVEKLAEATFESVKNIMRDIDRGVLAIQDEGPPAILEDTTGHFLKMFNLLDAPIPMKAFNSIHSGLTQLRSDAEDSRDVFHSLADSQGTAFETLKRLSTMVN